MTAERDELERIAARTLDHYEAERRGVLGRHARPRRAAEHRRAAAPSRRRRRRSRSSTSAAARAATSPPSAASATRRSASTAPPASSPWRARTAAARSGSRTCSPSTLPAARFDGIFANAVAVARARAASCRACSASCRRRCARAACCSARSRAATARRAGTAAATASTTSLAAWQRQGAAAGFVELEHYYRPEGRPREQQPWLASVWRRGDDPPP